MLIPNQQIKMIWTNRNRKQYEDKGYTFTEYGDIFYVKPQDLNKGSKQKVGFICDYCGETHYISHQNHMRWKNDQYEKYICLPCYRKNMAKFSLEKRRNDIYQKVKHQCDKYGYTLLTNKKDINSVNTKIVFMCPKHGRQERRAHLFVYGDHICPMCNNENKKMPVEKIALLIEEKGSKLINPEDYIDARTNNLKIYCRMCGDPFVTSLNSMIYTRSGDLQLCPNCSQRFSSGEAKIQKYLDKHGILYEAQKRFDDCKDFRTLPFDFFLPIQNLAIEYDGEQHYIPVPFSGDMESAIERLKDTQKHDVIKTIFCFNNHIHIMRISYREYDLIEKKLDNCLSHLT